MSEFINTIDVVGDADLLDSIINRSITEIKDSICSELKQYAFSNCVKLKSVDFQLVNKLNNYTFESCKQLTDVSLPLVKQTGQGTFSQCIALTKIILPSVNNIYHQAFDKCYLLELVDFPKVTWMYHTVFTNCYSLKAVIIRTESNVCTLNDVNAFQNCYHFYGTVDATYNPDGLQDGYVYVPKALVESYKTAAQWSTLYASHSNVFRALEDYTVDGTTTGELDESKI